MFKLFATVIVVVAPGKYPDQKAFERTQLFQIVSKLCPGQYKVGDADYTLTDQVLCPFVGNQRESTNKDVYNFLLSQLFIRIEMTFGLVDPDDILVLQPEEISCYSFCLKRTQFLPTHG